MKKVFFTLLFAPLFSFCQNYKLPLDSLGFVRYEKTIQVDSVSKDELYRRVKLWLPKGFNSVKDELIYDDKESGSIIEKGHFIALEILRYYQIGTTDFMFKLKINDGQYKYSFDSFIMQGESHSDFIPCKEKTPRYYEIDLCRQMDALILSLTEAMLNPVK